MGKPAAMPAKMLKFIDAFAGVVQRYELALAGVTAEASSGHDSFSQSVHRSVEVADKHVVDRVSPTDVIVEADYALVTGRAPKLLATHWLEARVGLP